MPASLDAVLRAGLRLQAEAPERFEAEATGGKLCNLYTAGRTFQYPPKIRGFRPVKFPKQSYVIKFHRMESKSSATALYDCEIDLFSKFGDSNMRTDKPYMVVRGVKVTPGTSGDTTFQVFYEITPKAPTGTNAEPVLEDALQKDFSIAFSDSNCYKNERDLANSVYVKNWTPQRWVLEIEGGRSSFKYGFNVNTRLPAGKMLEKATEDARLEMAHLVWKMAEAIKKANK